MSSFTEKCKAIGLSPRGMRDGLPTFEESGARVVLKQVGGLLKAFADRRYAAWEEPEEVQGFPQDTLDKVKILLDDATSNLTNEEQEALLQLESKAGFTPVPVELEAALGELLLEIAKERFKNKPQYLNNWATKVQAAGLEGALK